MLANTHIRGGVTAGLATVLALQPEPTTSAIIIGTALLGSLVPDIDRPGSKITHVPGGSIVSKVMSWMFGHRGLIHAPLFYVVVLWLLKPHVPLFVLQGLGAGVLSHLILDTLNPMGIPWLFPCVKKFHITKIETGSAGETGVRYLLTAANVILFLFIIKKALGY